MTLEDYLKDPCGSLSIPFWKLSLSPVPDGMAVVHDRRFSPEAYPGFTDTLYFRLYHPLKTVPAAPVPAGYALEDAPGDCEEAFAALINDSYPDIRVTADYLRALFREEPYAPQLRLFVREGTTGRIAGGGIAAFDRASGEGSLEWIQVRPEHRGRGVGRAVVCGLLARLREDVRLGGGVPLCERPAFATVSGRIDNETEPERLYRACGFTGCDLWHVLRAGGAK